VGNRWAIHIVWREIFILYLHVLLSGGTFNINSHLCSGLNFMYEQTFSHVRWLKFFRVLNVKFHFEVWASIKDIFIFLIVIDVQPAAKCSLMLHIFLVMEDLFNI